MSKRREKRRDKAEEVCKEIRKQIVKHGRIIDNEKITYIISNWLKYSIKDSYK